MMLDSPTVTGCRLGGYPAGRDQWGGDRVVGGMLPVINSGAAHGSRTTRSWQQLPGHVSSVVYVRWAPYACGRPARTQQRSVRVRAGIVYGCRVLARGQ